MQGEKKKESDSGFERCLEAINSVSHKYLESEHLISVASERPQKQHVDKQHPWIRLNSTLANVDPFPSVSMVMV